MDKYRDLIHETISFVKDGAFIAASETPESRDLTLVWCNHQLTKILRRDAIDLVGAPLMDLIEANELLDGPNPYPSANGDVSRYLLRQITDDRGAFEYELDLHALGRRLEGARYWIGIVSDVSEYARMERRLQGSLQEAQTARKRLWDAVEALPDAFLMLDKDDRLIAFNERFRTFYAHSAPAIFEGAEFGDIIRYGIENGQYPEAVGNEEDWLTERLDRASRLAGPIDRELPGNRHLVIHDVETQNGDIVGLRTDVTEFKRQQQFLEESKLALQRAKTEAEYASRTDELTGLANRRGLDIYMNGLTDSHANQVEAALMHIDLDRFKAINDVFGHAAGDQVLVTVSDIMRRCARPNDFVARVGGDEFVVVATAESHVQAVAEEIALRIIKCCQNPVWFDGKELRFGASIGIAVTVKTDLLGLMENADIALYEAKAGGRNQYALFTPSLRAMAEEKRVIADELLAGIADDQIVAHFQPQVSSTNNELVGAEALARWAHPIRGLVSPHVFLPIAEELGLLADIDGIVLTKTFAAVQQLKSDGMHVPKVSVNVSYRRLKTRDFLSGFGNLGPWPCKLAFELLETIDFDKDADELAWILDDLRERGVDIELDDFGSGRASITTLLRMRPDRIKIDQQLVAAVKKEGSYANPLVQAITQMGKAIGIQMTAEGIETDLQARVMRNLGCDVLQGHLFAKAMSEDDFGRWIRRRRETHHGQPEAQLKSKNRA